MAPNIGLSGRLDLTQFNANVQSFMRSIDSMNASVLKVAKESSSAAKTAGEAAGFLGVNWQRVKDIVSGVLVIDVFRQISRAIKSVTSDALDAVGVFQSLQVTLQSILARDFAKEWGVPVSEAFGAVSQKADELLGWIRRMAITTPFSVESLTQALAYGQAFGFNVQQAKRLTVATGEFTAGMGLTNEHMSRIIYNFGQMLASGRVLGRELRDLANNFVPIRDVTQKLADEAGIPFEEMKKAMSESRVSAEQFIAAFVQLAEQDFEGAMKRMSRTIQGVRQNISDFIRSVIGLEVLGPVMRRIAEIAADALDAAFSESNLRAFVAIGQVFLQAFEQIYQAAKELGTSIGKVFSALGLGAPGVFDLAKAFLYLSTILAGTIRFFSNVGTKIAEFITNISQSLGTTLGEVVRNAFTWGANIVIALAEGMAKAIIYIVQVLTAIAQIFTYWLRAFSPPRLLPDLALWGQKAMESYLKGWTSADFGIFQDIAGVISSFIRSLQIKETSIVPRILGGRKALQEAIDQFRKLGEVTEASLNKIFKAMKITSGAMKEFIKETFEFAAISHVIDQAKKVLDFDITLNVPTEIFGEMVSSFQDLLKIAEKFKGELGDALRGYVQALGDVEAATKRVSAAQEVLNHITELYDDRLRRLRALRSALDKEQTKGTRLKDIEQALASGLLTDEEKRKLMLEKQQILLDQKIDSLEQQREKAQDYAQDQLDAEKKLFDAAKERLEFQKKLAEEIAAQQLAAAQEQLDAAKARIDIEIETNQLLKEQAELLERLAKAAAAGKGGEPFDIPGLDFEGFIDQFEDALDESKEAITQAVEDLRKDVEKKVGEFITAITAPFTALPGKLQGLLRAVFGVFESAQQSSTIQGFVDSFSKFSADIQTVITNLKTFWDENGAGIIDIVSEFFTGILGALGLVGADVIEGAGKGLEGLGNVLVTMSEQLVENGPEIRASMQEWVDWFFNEALPKLKEFWGYVKEEVIPAIGEFVGTLIENAPKIIATAGAIFTGLNILNIVFGVLLKILPIIVPLIPPIASALGSLGTAFGSLFSLFTGGGALSTIGTTIGVFFLDLGATISGVVTTIGTGLSTLGSAFISVLPYLIPIVGVVLAVIDNAKLLGAIFAAVGKSIVKNLKPALEPLKPAFESLKKSFAAIKEAAQPILKTVVPALKLIGELILAVVVPAIILLAGIFVGVVRGLAEGIASFVKFASVIFQGIASIVSGVIKIFEGLWDIIKGLFTDNGDLVASGWERLWEGLKEVVLGLFATIIGALGAFFVSVYDALKGFVQGFIGFFVDLYNQLIGKSIIPDMLADIISAFTTFFVDTIASFTQWVSDVIASIASRFDEIVQTGRDFIVNLIDGIREKVYGAGGLLAKIKEYLDATIKKVASFAKDFLAKGKELIDNLIQGIKEKFELAGGVYEKIKEYIKTTITKITELYDDFVQAGKDIIAGIIAGLWAKAIDLYNTIKKIIQNALGTAEEESESKSPSKIMKELGIDWMVGFEEGIIEKASSVQNTVARIFAGLTELPGGLNFEAAGVSVESLVKRLKALRESGALGSLGATVDFRNVSGVNGGLAGSLLNQQSPAYSSVKNIHVEINPTYAAVQSEASIYYDVRAALAHMAR